MGIPNDLKEWGREDLNKIVDGVVEDAQTKRLFGKLFKELSDEEKESIRGS